ncbi:MAG: hypothetical protein K9G46_11795 [Flavobacteriales bacterium]|nr:hypothetical protein [Flavobacteriales bacterium]
MREVEIDIDQIHSRGDIDDALRESKLTKGDHVRFFKSKNVSAIQVFSVLFFMFLFLLNEKRKTFAEKILTDIFNKYQNEEELETEIEKEYGIKVTVETVNDPDREDWMRMSAIEFEKCFSDPDDDYSDVPLIELNPDYIPWKQGT